MVGQASTLPFLSSEELGYTNMFKETPIDKIIDKFEILMTWFDEFDNPIARLLLSPLCFISMCTWIVSMTILSTLNGIMYNK